MRNVGFIVGALALAGASSAWAQDEPERLLVYSSSPSEAARRAALPAGAPSTRFVLSCLAGKNTLSECKVVSQDPPGREDVGLAGVKFAQAQKFAANDRNGKPVMGRRFEVVWELLAPGDRNADWLRKPSAEQIAGVFPVKATRARKDGMAAIRCAVTIEGFLDRCQVVAEQPEGYDFGSAALLLSKQFAMTPKIRGGKAVEGEVTIPINWRGLAGGGAPMELAPGRVMTDPLWGRTPTRAAVDAAFPARAGDVPSGQVSLRCNLSKTGEATSCQVISENPPSRGFGAAAKSLASQFAVAFRPEEADQLRNLEVDIPFRFRNPLTADPGRLTDIRWTQTLSPQGADMLFPRAAAAAKVARGTGVVDCRAKADGGLEDCRVTREAPTDLGFGAAALQAAALMKMNPWTKGGDPVEGRRATLPITFVLPDSPSPAEPGAATAAPPP
jgi:TonB family protein